MGVSSRCVCVVLLVLLLLLTARSAKTPRVVDVLRNSEAYVAVSQEVGCLTAHKGQSPPGTDAVELSESLETVSRDDEEEEEEEEEDDDDDDENEREYKEWKNTNRSTPAEVVPMSFHGLPESFMTVRVHSIL